MKRVLSLITLLLTLTLLGTACSDPTTSSGSTPAAAVDPLGRLDGVHLTLWVAQGSSGQAKPAIDAFAKATGATIEEVVIPDPYESNVPTQLASGQKPDLMFWQ